MMLYSQNIGKKIIKSVSLLFNMGELITMVEQETKYEHLFKI